MDRMWVWKPGCLGFSPAVRMAGSPLELCPKHAVWLSGPPRVPLEGILVIFYIHFNADINPGGGGYHLHPEMNIMYQPWMLIIPSPNFWALVAVSSAISGTLTCD